MASSPAFDEDAPELIKAQLIDNFVEICTGEFEGTRKDAMTTMVNMPYEDALAEIFESACPERLAEVRG